MQDIIQEAVETMRERMKNYGDPIAFFSRFGEIVGRDPAEIVKDMMGLKYCRLLLSKSWEADHDSLVDLIGYAVILDKFNRSRQTGES